MSERDPLRDLWVGQKTGGFAMPVEEVRRRAGAFQSRIRTRNMTEYAAALFVLIAFGGVALTVPDWGVRAGAALIMLGTLYVVWKLHTMARAAGSGEIDTALSLTDFHKGELLRQRAALATVWRWYLMPFVPGMIVFLSAVSFTPDNPAPLAAKLIVFFFSLGIVGTLFAGIAWLNARAVKALDAEIAALERE
jgi:hypothetical protein